MHDVPWHRDGESLHFSRAGYSNCRFHRARSRQQIRKAGCAPHRIKFVRPGKPGGRSFQNPDGSIVLFVLNSSGGPMPFNIAWKGQFASYKMPAGAVAHLSGRQRLRSNSRPAFARHFWLHRDLAQISPTSRTEISSPNYLRAPVISCRQYAAKRAAKK